MYQLLGSVIIGVILLGWDTTNDHSVPGAVAITDAVSTDHQYEGLFFLDDDSVAARGDTPASNKEMKERDLDGVPGQGNANPPPVFANHFIVRYGGKFYDPSYGGDIYDSQWEWEDASLAGFGFFYDDSAGNIQLAAKRNDLGDTNIETEFRIGSRSGPLI